MHFQVNAVDAKQEIVVLHLTVANKAAAIETAHKRGLTVLSIRGRGFSVPFSFRRQPRFPTTLFSIELVSLLEAGLNLVEALQTLSDKEAHGERQMVISGILQAIYRGEPFSQAVTRFPRHFSPLYIATLKASERTGNIREALSRYISYREELDQVRKKVVSAMIYPTLLIVIGSMVLAFLMFYVVPRFSQVYEDISGNLPFFSAQLLALGRGIRQYGWIIAVLTVGCIALGFFGLSRSSVRAWLNQRVWQIPAVGERLKVYQLARLYRTVGMLLRSGIPVVQALDMMQDLLAVHLRSRLMQAKQLLEEGRSTSDALNTTGLATPVAMRMMLVGERGGEMGEMMGRIARFHDEETARSVDWFTRSFEPLLMTVLGVAIGGVVVLMYMPIFELAGSIQ